jgi:hypothetical protein
LKLSFFAAAWLAGGVAGYRGGVFFYKYPFTNKKL